MRERKSYHNFNVAIYCSVGNINHITDFDAFEKKLRHITDHIKVGRVYLECYRDMEWITKEQLIRVKEFFEAKGIETAGGITTNDDAKGEGYLSLCYSSEKGQKILEDAVRLSCEVFDEVIFDDFYFTNCRCPKCIEKKGNKSWRQARMEQKRFATQEIVMKTARETNPDCNMIIKYPQWYEYYNETGYDPVVEPKLFDSIYTGTETRNPAYSQQHLPKYLSYFIMRYLETASPGKNLGGWFDTYECTYNLTSYLEQGYLTLFGKAKEVTLFCLDTLITYPEYQAFAVAAGQMFTEVDAYLDKLGNPIGAVAYRPADGQGEDYLHNYLGMCGIPFEASMQYPVDANAVFLSEGACADADILDKMHDSLMAGSDVICSSGFVRKMGQAFRDRFVNVTYSDRKALVKEYANTKDNGLTISGCYAGREEILIPQMDYCTNDIWELAGAYGKANNYPIVLRCKYGNGRISIITIPDNPGNLYDYASPVLDTMRELFCKDMFVRMEGPSQVMLFAYDNDAFILRSDLNYDETVTIVLREDIKVITELVTGRTYQVVDGRVQIRLMPGVNYIFQA